MAKKRFMHPVVKVYTRKRMTSGTGKEYWGFEPVTLGAAERNVLPFSLFPVTGRFVVSSQNLRISASSSLLTVFSFL
jgi:hypothetical protein